MRTSTRDGSEARRRPRTSRRSLAPCAFPYSSAPGSPPQHLALRRRTRLHRRIVDEEGRPIGIARSIAIVSTQWCGLHVLCRGTVTPSIVLIGNLLVDDLVWDDGTTRMAQAGGAVLYAALGARLWNHRVGCVSVAGSDYPAEMLRSAACSAASISTACGGSTVQAFERGCSMKVTGGIWCIDSVARRMPPFRHQSKTCRPAGETRAHFICRRCHSTCQRTLRAVAPVRWRRVRRGRPA